MKRPSSATSLGLGQRGETSNLVRDLWQTPGGICPGGPMKYIQTLSALFSLSGVPGSQSTTRDLWRFPRPTRHPRPAKKTAVCSGCGRRHLQNTAGAEYVIRVRAREARSISWNYPQGAVRKWHLTPWSLDGGQHLVVRRLYRSVLSAQHRK